MHGGAGVARCGRLASLNLPYHKDRNVGAKGTEGVLFGVRRFKINSRFEIFAATSESFAVKINLNASIVFLPRRPQCRRKGHRGGVVRNAATLY